MMKPIVQLNTPALQEQEKQAIAHSAPEKWVGYRVNEIAGESELELQERYAVLLVMEGEVTLSFKEYLSRSVSGGSLIVIDKQEISGISHVAGTAILEFTPPERLSKFLRSYSKAFSIPCSTAVPILPELQQWVDELMAARLRPKEELGSVCRRDFCMRLGNILQHYPPLLVGELLVPFQACAMKGQKMCRAASPPTPLPRRGE